MRGSLNCLSCCFTFAHKHLEAGASVVWEELQEGRLVWGEAREKECGDSMLGAGSGTSKRWGQIFVL